MLSTSERVSNLKCKIANNSYVSLMENKYGIETCNGEYSEEMHLDDLLNIELLESGTDCKTVKVAKSLLPGEQSLVIPPQGLRFSFLTPSTTWTIDNLGIYGYTTNPSVTLLDLNNQVMEGVITYPEYAKKIVITFGLPIAGFVDIH